RDVDREPLSTAIACEGGTTTDVMLWTDPKTVRVASIYVTLAPAAEDVAHARCSSSTSSSARPSHRLPMRHGRACYQVSPVGGPVSASSSRRCRRRLRRARRYGASIAASSALPSLAFG